MKEKNNITTNNDFFLAEWLEGKITDIDLRKLVSNEDYYAFLKIKKGLDVFESLEKPLAPSFNSIQNKIESSKIKKLKKRNLQWGMSIAASMLVLFGLFSVFSNSEISYETSFAQQKTILLLDGSEVQLNAKSKITYSKKDWETHRDLYLDGEAYFKVKKGSTFTVHTNLGTIKVLGTQFNVNANSDFFEVTCFEGKVKVTNNSENFILTPGNKVRKINGDDVEKLFENSSFPSWTRGESNFKSVPLKYVISELEKQYNIKINASNIDSSSFFTGSFSHHDIDIALASVFKTMNIKYKKKKNRVVILE